MSKALEYVLYNVKQGGLLFIAIYNTQVYWTPIYIWLKRT